MFQNHHSASPDHQRCVNLQINKCWILLICLLCSDSLRTFEFNFQAFPCNINESRNFHLITFPHLQGKHQIPRCLGPKQELMTLSEWVSLTGSAKLSSKHLYQKFIITLYTLWYICWKSHLEFAHSVSQWHLRCVIHCGGTWGVEICHTSEQVLQTFSTCSVLSSSLSSSDQGSLKFAVVRKGFGFFFLG